MTKTDKGLRLEKFADHEYRTDDGYRAFKDQEAPGQFRATYAIWKGRWTYQGAYCLSGSARTLAQANEIIARDREAHQ